MRSISERTVLFLPFLIFITFNGHFHLDAAQNTIFFGKFDCMSVANFVSANCDMKRISRDSLRIHINLTLSRPLNDIWAHGVFYFKYNQFQKFPIDLWEDACSWLSGKKKSYLLEWTTGYLLSFSNVNHSCPYMDAIIVKADNISIKKLLAFEMFLPSGRFRMDLNLTEGYRKSAFLMTSTYFTISDNRIEQF